MDNHFGSYQKDVEAEQLLNVNGDSTTPIIPIEASSTQRSKVAKAIVAFTAVGALAAVATHSSGQGSGRSTPAMDMASSGRIGTAEETFGDDIYDYDDVLADEEYNCTNYDDDTTFTADVCSTYDYSTCYGENSMASSCVDSFWCNKLCGDMCDEGAGAICFFQKVSDLQTTCSTVANLRATQNQTTNPWAPDGLSAEESRRKKEGDKGDDDTSCGKGCSAATEMAAEEELHVPGPARVLSPEEAKAFMDEVYPRSSTVSDVAKTTETTETGHGLSDDISDEGCGRHSYCTDCTDFCREKLMKKYLSNKFGVDTGASVGGYSPSSLKQALENVVETCAYFGMYV